MQIATSGKNISLMTIRIPVLDIHLLKSTNEILQVQEIEFMIAQNTCN